MSPLSINCAAEEAHERERLDASARWLRKTGSVTMLEQKEARPMKLRALAPGLVGEAAGRIP